MQLNPWSSLLSQYCLCRTISVFVFAAWCSFEGIFTDILAGFRFNVFQQILLYKKKLLEEGFQNKTTTTKRRTLLLRVQQILCCWRESYAQGFSPLKVCCHDSAKNLENFGRPAPSPCTEVAILDARQDEREVAFSKQLHPLREKPSRDDECRGKEMEHKKHARQRAVRQLGDSRRVERFQSRAWSLPPLHLLWVSFRVQSLCCSVHEGNCVLRVQ